MKPGWSMYLHEDKENFKNIIERVQDSTGRDGIVIEKDYYVTMLLRLLSEALPNVVFKGGTSLSKGYKVIKRFSEDVDITFDEHIGEARRKKLETALGSYAFPTERVSISSYVGDFFALKDRMDLAKKFKLAPFEMKLQSIERTYVDKIFALCDYYMQNKSKRYSRHLYDIYKLSGKIHFDEDFVKLYYEIREHRKQMKICPSAQEGVDISAIIRDFCSEDFYKEDYEIITSYFSEDYVAYEETIAQMMQIAEELEQLQNRYKELGIKDGICTKDI